MSELYPAAPAAGPSLLRRPAPKVLAAAGVSVFASEMAFIFLPVALVSQGFSFSATPAWFDWFVSYGLPSTLGLSAFASMVVPRKGRGEDETVLLLRKRIAVLEAELSKSQAPRVTPVAAVAAAQVSTVDEQAGEAKERPLRPEPTAKDKQELYSRGKKLWQWSE